MRTYSRSSKAAASNAISPEAEGYETSGLDLTTYEGLMKGTKFGAMVIPGDPDSSNLMWLLDWVRVPSCGCRTV